MGRRLTLAALAAGALIATAAIGAARDGGEECPNVGTRWVPQKLASVGGVQCPSAEFRLTIGFDQLWLAGGSPDDFRLISVCF